MEETPLSPTRHRQLVLPDPKVLQEILNTPLEFDTASDEENCQVRFIIFAKGNQTRKSMAHDNLENGG